MPCRLCARTSAPPPIGRPVLRQRLCLRRRGSRSVAQSPSAARRPPRLPPDREGRGRPRSDPLRPRGHGAGAPGGARRQLPPGSAGRAALRAESHAPRARPGARRAAVRGAAARRGARAPPAPAARRPHERRRDRDPGPGAGRRAPPRLRADLAAGHDAGRGPPASAGDARLAGPPPRRDGRGPARLRAPGRPPRLPLGPLPRLVDQGRARPGGRPAASRARRAGARPLRGGGGARALPPSARGHPRRRERPQRHRGGAAGPPPRGERPPRLRRHAPRADGGGAGGGGRLRSARAGGPARGGGRGRRGLPRRLPARGGGDPAPLRPA